MDDLKHYGMPRRSGRYRWGSGKNPQQRYKNFAGRVEELRKEGKGYTQIAKEMGISTTQLKAKISIASDEIRKANMNFAQKLMDKGYSRSATARRMGVPESTIRSWENQTRRQRASITQASADALKRAVERDKYVDVGKGIEQQLGISPTKLIAVNALLQEQGYQIQSHNIKQAGTGKQTNLRVLVKEGTPYSEVRQNLDKIGAVKEYSEDGGKTYNELSDPTSISSSRIKVKYASDNPSEDGRLKDGVIELRRGVPDLNLGEAKYAQVRVAVDGTHYLKGMAVYKDDMPDGVDIIYNTHYEKKADDPLFGLKEMKKDPSNPFGASIKVEDELKLVQRHYIDPSTGEKKLSALNIVNEEGNWSDWRKTISSQVLSKQTPELAKKQLGIAYDIRKEEFDELSSLTNPAVKQKLLNSFADDCDAAAVHLKAAALPRQGSHVILPFPEMPDNEVYAPNFRDGERVVLIRYPHGGIFEIPELTVNNKSPAPLKTIKQARDAIGINSKVAEQLSGADFDGDTVLVIPNNNRSIRTSAPLEGLKNFDPHTQYKLPPGKPVISAKLMQQEMGKISNLITDMTIRGASPEEIAGAVKHSMVVIDSRKHKLDYQQSFIDNGISGLKAKWQGKETSGASTLISRSSSTKRVDERKEGQLIYDPDTGKKRRLFINPDTGEKLYSDTGGEYIKRTVRDPVSKKTKSVYWDRNLKSWAYDSEDADGTKRRTPVTTEHISEKLTKRQTVTTKMADTADAYSLSSGTIMETYYADYANKLKSLANTARKEAYSTNLVNQTPSAKETYSAERVSLMSKLNKARENAPFERKAQALAAKRVRLQQDENPNMDDDELKKLRGRAITSARLQVGAKKYQIEITDNEWNAIQAGALSKTMLRDVLDNTNLDVVKQRAMPRTSKGLSTARIARAKTMLALGNTQAAVAEALGVSVSTLMKAVQ